LERLPRRSRDPRSTTIMVRIERVAGSKDFMTCWAGLRVENEEVADQAGVKQPARATASPSFFPSSRGDPSSGRVALLRNRMNPKYHGI